MRDFNVKINTAILEDNQTNIKEEYADEDINKAVKVCNEIIKVLSDNDVDMEKAYMILVSLAESVYISSICGGAIIE